MSTNHGGIETQKPIGEYAKYIKNLIPANIPEAYALKPIFENIASKENIRNGILAFRDFLYLFCDRLITDGHLYSKPQKTKNPTDYPFLNNINRLLIDIDHHGRLDESSDSLLAYAHEDKCIGPIRPNRREWTCEKLITIYIAIKAKLNCKAFYHPKPKTGPGARPIQGKL